MPTPSPHQDNAPTIRDLYPDLTDEELKEARENLSRFVALTLRIFERISAAADTKAHTETLTDQESFPTVKSERSNTF
jgi:hypothetical protein